MASLPSNLPSTFTLSQALAAGATKKGLYRLRDRGELEELARGVFRRAESPERDFDLVPIALRAPEATLCLVTALARHALSDALIAAPDIALPRGRRPPAANTPVEWHFFQPETFALERSLLELADQVSIGIYTAERSIVDAFRLRGREGHDVAYEALRRWLRRRGAEPARLLELAEKLPRATAPLRHALEVLL
jgi:hypothetical protein